MSLMLLLGYSVRAQTGNPLPAQAQVVGTSGTAAPTRQDFTIATAENLTVTLTDLQIPAALSSANIVVTQGGTIVGEAILAPPATSANFPITGAVGQYRLWVFGAPNSAYSVGTFTACVAPTANPTNCIADASLAGNISLPSSAADPTVSTLSIPLTVVTGGSYTVSFQDDQFPAALNSAPNLALFQGSLQVALAIQSGTTVSLSPGTYTLLGIAQASQTAKAGLYGISITGPAGTTPLLDASIPVGTLAAAEQGTNPSAQTITLSFTDFAFPTPLASGAAIATAGSTVLGSVALGAQAASFSAPQGPVSMWTYATASSGAGTYEVDLDANGASIALAIGAVNGATQLAYAYVSPALSAGGYQATAGDFQFPATLPALQFAVAQNDLILAQATSANTLPFTAAAGPVILLAAVTPPTGGNGLFDLNIETTGATPQLEFDKTQPVSLTGLFDTQTFTLGASGNFAVQLTDLKFPGQFDGLDLVVSSGGNVLGKIIGGGSFSINATPGTYQLTFIATPAAQQQFGMYGLQITTSAPTLTLSASPTSVVAGASTTLTWASTNVTSCTATGGSFAGSQATSGSLAVGVATDTTFTLTCTGPGGTVTQSVSVTTSTNGKSSSSGGGGGMDPWLLGVVGLLVAVRIRETNGKRV